MAVSTDVLIILVNMLGFIFLIAGVISGIRSVGLIFGGKGAGGEVAEHIGRRIGARSTSEKKPGYLKRLVRGYMGKADKRAAEEELAKKEQQNVAANEEAERRNAEIKRREAEMAKHVAQQEKSDLLSQRALANTSRTMQKFYDAKTTGEQTEALNETAKSLAVAAAALEDEKKLASWQEAVSKDIGKKANNLVAEELLQRKAEKSSVAAEKAAGDKEAAKQSEQAVDATVTGKTAARGIRRGAEDIGKASEEISEEAEKELKLLGKAQELISRINYAKSIGIAKEKLKLLVDQLNSLLKQIYGSEQKINSDIEQIQKAHEVIHAEEVTFENALKIKKGLDMLKAKKLSRRLISMREQG